MYSIEQQFEFYETNAGWWLRLSSRLDVDKYCRQFARRRFEKATTNLLEGKEYGNKTISHGPYSDEAPLAMFASLRTQNTEGYTNPKNALSELCSIREEYINNLKKAIATNNEVYVNRKGGFTYKLPEPALQVITASDFPPCKK